MKHFKWFRILVIILVAMVLAGGWSLIPRMLQPSATTVAEANLAAPVPQPDNGSGAPSESNSEDPKNSRASKPAPRRWEIPAAAAPFVEFATWANRYASAGTPEEKNSLEAEGVALAQVRRAALKDLIRNDPEQALQLAAPLATRQILPPSIVSLLEDQINGRGELAVMAALPEPGKESEVIPLFRTATVGGQEYEAYVYGWREGQPTRRNIPLHGIAVDSLFAISANPVRILEPEEAEGLKALAGEAICGISGQAATVNNEPTPVAVGEEIKFLCRPLHAETLNQQLIAAEGSGPTGGAGADEPQASAWTEGLKKLILIRVDFPDLTLSLTESGGTTLISNLHNFYSEMSYGRSGFALAGSGSEVTPVFRMANPAAYYGTNNYYNQLRSEARAAATAAGYNLANYNLDVICIGAVPGFGWSGLAYVGSAGAWLRNSFGTGVAGHELGHNFGLNHAGFWDTGGKSIIGPGSNVEYGDSFDTMGAANAGANHFNTHYKSYLNWLQPAEMQTVTSSGMYRITAHDDPNASGIRGLRIARNSQTNYLVEFRQKFTSNKWMQNGASLRWVQSGNQRSQLLDTTPGSSDGKNDAPLVIGRTFADPQAGVYITPLRKAGTSPESLDVFVSLGGVSDNVAPVVSATASSTESPVNTMVQFTAVASDANGDTLAYFWDFGDGNFGTNGPVASKSWSTAGEYVVRCTVSDLKGGQASDSVVVRIGSPTTYRISGQITDGGVPLEGVRVYVSTTRMTYTDSDGTYNLVGLPAGSYTVNASLYPYTFATANFDNPVSVGPNAMGVNFISTNLIAPNITAQPLSQAVNPGATVTFSVAATGSQPMTYQWRFNGVNITSATNSSYTRTNVQTAQAGNYSVVVANGAGSATSANAALTVNTPPSITAQPQSQTVIAGTSVTFNVTVTGSSPLSYQWRLGGSDIAGATASSFTRANVQPAQAGSYSVVIANSLGAVTSSVANLTVNFALTTTATAGGTLSRSPNQASYAPNAVVTLTASSLSVYRFTGWTGDASGTNNPLTVVMTGNKTIGAEFTSPVADVIVDNPTASFSGNWALNTSGEGIYGSNFRSTSSGGNSASATARFTPLLTASGRYDIHVWQPALSKASANVPVTVSSAEGTSTLVLDQTTGGGNWKLLASGVPFVAGNSGFVQIGNNIGQGGKTIAADAVRWAYSPVQDVLPPTLVVQPQPQTADQDATVTFSVEASGTTPLSYQWFWNESALPGATSATLICSNIQPANAGYYSVVVTNAAGSVVSSPALLTVLGAPVILSQPLSQAVGVESNTVFNVAVSGATPLTYLWRRDDAPLTDDSRITGTTTSTLTLREVLPSDAGAYTVIISNRFGIVTSELAFLGVGFEGDTYPLPNGDNLVSGGDRESIARWLTSLESLDENLVFMRADCAPRATLGDGAITLADWVQAGRYAMNLDPATQVGGPASPVSLRSRSTEPAISAAIVRLTSAPLIRGQNNNVDVELVSQGAENALAFTLVFDSTQLTYRGIALGSSAADTDTVLMVNTNSVSNGRLGVVLGRSAGTAFAVGTNQLLRLNFAVVDSATNCMVSFGDEPVARESVSIAAAQLPMETQTALLPLAAGTPLALHSSALSLDRGFGFTLTGVPGQRIAIEATTNLVDWSLLATLTNLTGTVQFNDTDAASVGRRFYRARLVSE